MHDLVIFDCDGVLVDSEVISNRVLAANLTKHGLPMSPEDCMARFVGGTMASVHEKVRAKGARVSDDWVSEIYAEIYAALRAGTPLVSGVNALLDRLDKANLPYCVASNGSPEKMDITLGQNGLLPRFRNAIFSAHVLKTAKPDPDLFVIAAREMGGTNPVVVEDSPSGVIAAGRAGFRCLGYAPHSDGARLADHGAEVFHAMAEVPDLLGL